MSWLVLTLIVHVNIVLCYIFFNDDTGGDNNKGVRTNWQALLYCWEKNLKRRTLKSFTETCFFYFIFKFAKAVHGIIWCVISERWKYEMLPYLPTGFVSKNPRWDRSILENIKLCSAWDASTVTLKNINALRIPNKNTQAIIPLNTAIL